MRCTAIYIVWDARPASITQCDAEAKYRKRGIYTGAFYPVCANHRNMGVPLLVLTSCEHMGL